MNILSLLSDAQKLTPDQRTQSVKDGVLPPDLANMVNQTETPLHQTQPQPQNQGSIQDEVMSGADQATDPRNEIMDKIEMIKGDILKIKEAVQIGDVKPYVGIPLLEKKIGELNQLQQLIQPQQPMQPPQVQPQAQPQAQGLNALQSNLPTQMAHGGIVNLASGDLIDDEDDEDDDDYARLMRNMPMGEGIGSSIMAVADKSKPKYSSFKQPEMVVEKKEVSTPSGGIHDIITEKANKYKLPPNLLHSIAQAESGLNPNAGNGKSSAKGLFQFVDSTWEGMGGKKGEQFDPNLNAEYGAKYIRQNAEYLKNKLGRNPKYSEVYGAHFFGPSGASSLLSRTNPDMPIEKGLGLFESHKRVKAIMAQNPNLKGKTVGQVFGDLEKKTGEGIVGLAKGGHIKRFNGIYGPALVTDDYGNIVNRQALQTPIDAEKLNPNWNRKTVKELVGQNKTPFTVGNNIVNKEIPKIRLGVGDDTNTYGGMQDLNYYNELLEQSKKDPSYQPYQDEIAKLLKKNPDLPSQKNTVTPNLLGALSPKNVSGKSVQNQIQEPSRNLFSNTQDTEDMEKGKTKPVNTPYDPDVEDLAMGEAMKINERTAQEENAKEKPKSAWDEYFQQLKDSREELKKSHETDKYMGLLMAGLGMMGGTSQFGASNIGKGAMAGVQHYSDLQKQQAAEKANLDKLQASALRAQGIEGLYANRETPEERKAKLDRLIASDLNSAQEKAFQNATRYKDSALARLKAQGFDVDNKITWTPKQHEEFQKRLLAIENDPYYLAEMKKSGLPPPPSFDGFKVLPK